ncbi:MAG: AbrB/MazE/SpoVT family DNA-binding domain-containing protein [Candidatus Njordarchaeales archaeon]
MAVVKVTRNRQITIPSKIAKRLGIKEGDYVKVVLRGNEIVIRKIKKLDELAGSWENVDVKELSKVIRERWKRWSSV